MNEPRARTGRRKALWLVAGLLILAAGIGGFLLLRALRPQPQQVEEPVPVPSVQTLPLQHRQSPLIVSGDGFVNPRAEVTLAAQVNGEVTEVHPELVSGGILQQGDTVVRIDPRTYEANLAEARASLRVLEADLGYLDKQIERVRTLREDGYAPEENLDDLLSRREQTRANIARQEAVVRARELELERTAVKAPFTGRVRSKSVEVGDVVSPGMELGRLYASDAVEIVVSLTSRDLPFIPGLWRQDNDTRLPARAILDQAGRRYRWDGYVHRVEADIDPETRTVDVVVRIPEPFTGGRLIDKPDDSLSAESPPLLVGTYANVEIEGARLPEHFILPVSAVRENHTLWTVTDEGRLQVEDVNFVRQEGNLAVLLAPQLESGTPIIVSDIALVSEGMQVRVEREAENPVRVPEQAVQDAVRDNTRESEPRESEAP